MCAVEDDPGVLSFASHPAGRPLTSIIHELSLPNTPAPSLSQYGHCPHGTSSSRSGPLCSSLGSCRGLSHKSDPTAPLLQVLHQLPSHSEVNLQSLQRLTRPLGPASAHHLTPVHFRHLTPGVLLFLDQIHTFPPQGLWMCWSPFQEHCPSRYMHSSPSCRSVSVSYHPCLTSLSKPVSPCLYPRILLILYTLLQLYFLLYYLTLYIYWLACCSFPDRRWKPRPFCPLLYLQSDIRTVPSSQCVRNRHGNTESSYLTPSDLFR